MKKVFIIIVSLFIAICPCLTFCDFSYAEETETPPSGYMPVMNEQQKVAAWKAYCASRNNKTIMNFVQQNTPLSVYEKFIYQKLQECAEDANVDLDQLSAEMYYNISNNDVLSFWYSTSALNTLNMLFNVWLNKNNQDVDSPDYNTPNTENIYSGVTFETYDGDSCLVYIIDSAAVTQGTMLKSAIMSAGTPLISSSELENEVSSGDNHILINLTKGRTFETNITTQNMVGNTSQKLLTFNVSTSNNNNCLQIYPYNNASSYSPIKAQLAIVYYSQARVFALKALSFNRDALFRVNLGNFYLFSGASFSPTSTTNTDINNTQGDYNEVTYNNPIILVTNNNTVNNFNNDYGDDVTIVRPKEKPSQKPVDPDSVKPSDNPTIDPGNPDFNFTMPDINIDWNLDLDPDNLPFPFSIPNDIYHAFDSLNVEAEAPHFEGTVDLYVCEWDIDIDFEQFADLANIFNKWFLFVYVVGLIIATRSLMHIY